MKDTVETINLFKENIVIQCILMILFIGVLTTILCIIRKKARSKDSIHYKVRWIVLVLLIFTCMRLFMFIPVSIDISTNNIKVIEISDYSCRYNHQGSGSLNPSGTTISFSTVDGERMYGHLVDEFEIPSSGHGYILYAKYSHYILDCELYE